MNLLINYGARGLEDLRKQQNKMRDKGRTVSLNQTSSSYNEALAPLQSTQGGLKKQASAIQQTLSNQSMFEKKSNTGGVLQPKKYILTVLRENGNYEQLTTEEMEAFERENPDIAQFWSDPSCLDNLELPKYSPEVAASIFESWDLAAKKLLSKLWKVNQAWIFHEPVDADKLDIPDYYEVVAEPMDLGTVKNKLNMNKYRHVQEFIDDVHLVFSNCIKYNGEDSSVGKMCKNVREEFFKLYN